MCGLFGVHPLATQELSYAINILNNLSHRGPDQSDHIYKQSEIFIGHTRLSILDLTENGKQPMSDPSGNVTITVNGEIYNYQELKDSLRYKYQFTSESDSEILLFGYLEWGIDELLSKIDGMYALTIHEKATNTLFLARDRVGIKPLYYSTLGHKISWASEIQILADFHKDKCPLEYDYTAMYDFLTYLYIPTPKTMYKSIYKLEPAHYLKIDLSTHQMTKTQYWELPTEHCNDDLTTAKSTIFSLVQESIQEQLISDVPVGFFLSGGMDSSTLVALGSTLSDNVSTFNLNFQNNPNNESVYANLVSQQYKSTHHEITLNQEESTDLLDRMPDWYGEPFADTSAIPTYTICEFARNYATVILTGDGGDEVFGGYNWYKKFIGDTSSRFTSFIKFKAVLKRILHIFPVKLSLLHKIETKLLNELEFHTRLMGGLLSFEKSHYRKLWNIPKTYDDYWYFRKFYREDLDHITRYQYLDFHTYLPDDILTKLDRVSMAVSLECRVPLLSKKLIEYVFSLKSEIRLYDSQLKGIMKHTFKHLLPAEITTRNKQGFSVPMHEWKTSLLGRHSSRQEKILNQFGVV